jgi:hypothetical protein
MDENYRVKELVTEFIEELMVLREKCLLIKSAHLEDCSCRSPAISGSKHNLLAVRFVKRNLC